MEMNGEVLVAAPCQRVWAALNDTEMLRRCIPGCEAMVATSAHEKAATVAIKVGPVRARFSGRVRMDEVREGVGCTLHFEGQGGAAGMARGSSRVELIDEGGATRLRYQTQASVAGKLGQVGGRMIDAAARQMADRFFAALQAEVAPEAAVHADVPGAFDSGAAGDAFDSGAAGDAFDSGAAGDAFDSGAAGDAFDSGAAGAPAPATPPAPSAPAVKPLLHRAAPAPASISENQRVLWFVLGALATGFGVWLGRALFS